MTLASSTGSPALDIAGYVLQYGLLGLVFVDVAITRKVLTLAWILKREETERERERAASGNLIAEQKATIQRLTNLAEDQVIPALTNATELNRSYLQLLQERRHDQR